MVLGFGKREKQNKQHVCKEFLRLGHMCEIAAEEDIIGQVLAGDTLLVRFQRWLFQMCMVNEGLCKTATITLRSHGAVVKEQIRQLKLHRYSIHPYSVLRIKWITAMLFFIMINLLMCPVEFSYFDRPHIYPFVVSPFWVGPMIFLDITFCLDVLMSSFTGYYDENKKEIILNRKKTFKNYVTKGYFFIEVLSSIPIRIFIKSIENETVRRVYQVACLLKILKWTTFFKYFKIKSEIYEYNVYFRQIMIMFIITVTYLQWTVALYHNLMDRPEISHDHNDSIFEVGACDIYGATSLMFASSGSSRLYLEVRDYWFACLVWFSSRVLKIYLLARIIELFKAHHSAHQKYLGMVTQLGEFMRHKQLPIYTQKRISKYYDFHFHRSQFREAEIYNTISSQLRQEIILQTCRQLVENVAFFRNLPLNLLTRIVSCLQPEVYLTNDVVVKANTPGNSMYFISSGTVAVYTSSGKEVVHLENGAHFGEIALVMKNELRVASVVAVEVCELYRLDRKDFVKAIHPYPDLLEKIQRIAAERMEHTTLLDEHDRREKINKAMAANPKRPTQTSSAIYKTASNNYQY